MIEQQTADTRQPAMVTVGHWSDLDARTGCTVVLFDRPVPAVIDVRGGAPGTRETDVLGPGRLVQHVDALLLTGGSAFGLAAADGVMRYLADLGRGVTTSGGPVPIVPAAVLFDLGVGQPIAPDATAGQLACAAAVPLTAVARGRVGVGVGATTGKLLTGSAGERGGFGLGHVAWQDGAVTALAAVNAVGQVVDPATGRPVLRQEPGDPRLNLLSSVPVSRDREATTLCVVLVEAPTDERGLTRCAVAAHDGLARTIRPCHTIFDGDVVFVVGLMAGSPPPSEILRMSMAAELAVERAVLDAVTA